MKNYFAHFYPQLIAVNQYKKKVVYSNEYGSPVCTITTGELHSGNVNLISAFSAIFSSNLKFCNICNKKPATYYTQKQYLKSGELAQYMFHIISDVILPKFLVFIFEDDNEGHISGVKTKSLIIPEIIIRNQKYVLSGGICTPVDKHFSAFLVNYMCNYFDLEYNGNYYYDRMQYSGAIIKIDNIYDYITTKNPYLVIYLKLD